MINPIKIAKANKMIEVVEVSVSKLECTATAKGNIDYGANTFAKRACNEYHVTVNAIKKLQDQAAIRVLQELWGTVAAQYPLKGQ